VGVNRTRPTFVLIGCACSEIFCCSSIRCSLSAVPRVRFKELRGADGCRHYRTLHQQDGRYRFPQRRGSGEYPARELSADRHARSRGRARRTARFPRSQRDSSVKREPVGAWLEGFSMPRRRAHLAASRTREATRRASRAVERLFTPFVRRTHPSRTQELDRGARGATFSDRA